MTNDSLYTLAQQVQSCTLCNLHHGRVRGVPGEGPPDARMMVIGEGPGYHENRQGRPFVGPSGQFLDELLTLAGLQRNDVFISNVIKCRPPDNRDPAPDELAICTRTYLLRQIELIDPPVIVTLGRFSMALYFPKERISRMHGQARRIGGRVVVPLMHPAAALHQPKNRALIEEDFRRLPEILAQAETLADEPPPPDEPPEPEQLRMF